jgi:hypothetical protein
MHYASFTLSEGNVKKARGHDRVPYEIRITRKNRGCTAYKSSHSSLFEIIFPSYHQVVILRLRLIIN